MGSIFLRRKQVTSKLRKRLSQIFMAVLEYMNLNRYLLKKKEKTIRE